MFLIMVTSHCERDMSPRNCGKGKLNFKVLHSQFWFRPQTPLHVTRFCFLVVVVVFISPKPSPFPKLVRSKEYLTKAGLDSHFLLWISVEPLNLSFTL